MAEAIVDANILIRHLTSNPPDQAARVTVLLREAEQSGAALVVAPVTVAEVVYVLGSVYRWPRQEVVEGLLTLMSASALVFLEQDVVQEALTLFRGIPTVHFADAYVAALARDRGHGVVMSFDRALSRVPGVTRVQERKTTYRA